MSTVLGVVKNGVVALGTDSLASIGSTRQEAGFATNRLKVLVVADTFIGLCGSATSYLALGQVFRDPQFQSSFVSKAEIFETMVRAHRRLRTDFHLLAGNERERSFELSPFSAMIANRSGLYTVSSERNVEQIQTYWAQGSGYDFALGAMHAVYERVDDARSIALAGLCAAAQFDDSSSEPFDIRTVPLSSLT